MNLLKSNMISQEMIVQSSRDQLLKLLKILTASGETRSWNSWTQLMSTFQIPERDTDKPFLMPVEDVFSITGRGTVATGRVERGVLHVSDEVEIVGIQGRR